MELNGQFVMLSYHKLFNKKTRLYSVIILLVYFFIQHLTLTLALTAYFLEKAKKKYELER